MLRAMRWLALTLFAAALLPAGLTAQSVNAVNGIGLIDYKRKPDFKVGDWVRYRITGSNLSGRTDDYLVTVSIVGEENFWGEEGFWVETWTEPKDRPPVGNASFMSYAIFDDSLPAQRMLLYQRKVINESDGAGNAVQVVMRRGPSSLKLRTPYDDKMAIDVDTLGTDTVSVPAGDFQCVKVRTRSGKALTNDVGDSTEYTESWDTRTGYYSRSIPITSLLREQIELDFKERKWQIGRSESAPPVRIVDHSIGEARLIDFGTGMEGHVVPKWLQKSLPGRHASERPPRRPPPPPPRNKSG